HHRSPDESKPVEANNSSDTPSSKAVGPSPCLHFLLFLPSSFYSSSQFSLFPSFSLSVIATERPRQMKLRVMGDWFKEVAEWWGEVHTVEEIKPEPVFSKQEDEESVNVERTGDDVLGI
ncbi:hypothetical protein LINPERPRIM_LOCUS40601, partial [Linum perenne]